MLPGFLGRTQPDRMAGVSLLWEAVCLMSHLHRGGRASNVGDKGVTSRPLSVDRVGGGSLSTACAPALWEAELSVLGAPTFPP